MASAATKQTVAPTAPRPRRGLGHLFQALGTLGLALLLLQPVATIADDEFLQPDQAFRISGEAAGQDAVLVRWDIEPGYYMYQSKFRFSSETPGIETGRADLPPAETKQDEFFGEVQIYRDRMEARVPVQRTADAGDIVEFHTTSQGCADAGLCYPPQKQKILLELPKLAAVDQPAAQTPERLSTQSLAVADALPASSPGKSALGAMTQSLGLGLEDDILPAEEAFRFNAEVSGPDALALQWEVAPETYLYQEKIELTLEDADGVQLGAYELPEAEVKANTVRPDGSIGDVAIYHGTVDLQVPLLRGSAEPTAVTLVAKFQGCAERGICYPPVTERVTLELPAALQTVALTEPAAPAAPQTAPPNRRDRRARVGTGPDRRTAGQCRHLRRDRHLLRARSAAGLHPLRVPDDPDPVRHHRWPGRQHHHPQGLHAVAGLRAGDGVDLCRGRRHRRSVRRQSPGDLPESLGTDGVRRRVRGPGHVDVRLLRPATAQQRSDQTHRDQQ